MVQEPVEQHRRPDMFEENRRREAAAIAVQQVVQGGEPLQANDGAAGGLVRATVV